MHGGTAEIKFSYNELKPIDSVIGRKYDHARIKGCNNILLVDIIFSLLRFDYKKTHVMPS